MLRTALALAKRKLHVFPCLERAKTPAVALGFRAATVDPQIIRGWWGARPDCNVAIATGAISGVFVVDVDGVDGEFELRRLEAEHDTLPSTVEVITGAGRHLYFRMPEMPVRNSAGKVADNIDVRGDGGYVLVPPSIHPSGRAYTWSCDSANAFAVAPAWLLAKAGKTANGNTPTPPTEWRDLVLGGVGEGRRNHAATRLAGYLLRRHVDPLVALEFLTAWNITRCVPPLPTDELERIVGSICKIELRRRAADG